jgi:hypothetical protein
MTNDTKLDRQLDLLFRSNFLPKEEKVMNKHAVSTVGFWSALSAFVFSNAFTVGAVVPVFAFGPGTFLQMLDGIAYFYSCLAAFFTAPIFADKGLERWLRWTAVANGIVAIPVFISYIYFNIALGIWWSLTIPLFTILLAIYFRRRSRLVQSTLQ